MNKYILIAVIVSAVIVSGCIQDQEPLIGGQRDEYGCLGPAGYSYDGNLHICARSWEIVSDDQRKAISIAVNDTADRYGLTLVEMVQQNCDGCYAIKFDRLGEQIEVTLVNWTVQ